MFYVYGICDSLRCPSVPGLEGAPLSVMGGDGVFAVWSEHPKSRVAADETSLWEHERVVEALLADGAMLPMRFGSRVGDHEALLEFLRERHDEFVLRLDRVRGAVEIGVRALVRSAPAKLSPGATDAFRSGTAYLLARLNQESRSAAIAARIHEPLAALSRAATARRSSLAGSLNTAYLVDQENVGSFRSRVEELDSALGGATVVCTGPWPPYSFTEEVQ